MHATKFADMPWVWSWGFTGLGQLGDGATTDRSSPGAAPSLAGAGLIAAGSGHSLATTPALAVQTTTHSYDKLYRLTAVDAPGIALHTPYTYGPAGNRAAGGVSYTMNANSNLTARGSDSFAYDQANRRRAWPRRGSGRSRGWVRAAMKSPCPRAKPPCLPVIDRLCSGHSLHE
jgi:hypothetical protein